MGVAALSALRALLVLEYFEKVRSPLTLKAISEHLDLPSSSAAALLKGLASLDYLSYDTEARTYLPTLRLASLGEWVPKRIMDDGVLDFVSRLRDRTTETIVLTTLNDLYMDCIDFQVGSLYRNTYALEQNLRYPRGTVAITCPMGWYLFRHLKCARLERIYYRSAAKRLFDTTALSLDMFLQHVANARDSKYIVATNWPYPDTAVLEIGRAHV